MTSAVVNRPERFVDTAGGSSGASPRDVRGSATSDRGFVDPRSSRSSGFASRAPHELSCLARWGFRFFELATDQVVSQDICPVYSVAIVCLGPRIPWRPRGADETTTIGSSASARAHGHLDPSLSRRTAARASALRRRSGSRPRTASSSDGAARDLRRPSRGRRPSDASGSASARHRR